MGLKNNIENVIFIISIIMLTCSINFIFLMMYDSGKMQSEIFTTENITNYYFEYEGMMNGSLVNGIYNNKGYFCVVTKDRPKEEIARTTFHELAHYFVDDDPEHFTKNVDICKSGKNESE